MGTTKHDITIKIGKKRKQKKEQKKKTASVPANLSVEAMLNCLLMSSMHGCVLISIELVSEKEQDSQHICRMILQCWLHCYYCCVCQLYNMIVYISQWKLEMFTCSVCSMNNLPQLKCILWNKCILCYDPISTILRNNSS